MLTVFVLLAIGAFVLTLLAAINRVPLWIAVSFSASSSCSGVAAGAVGACMAEQDGERLEATVWRQKSRDHH